MRPSAFLTGRRTFPGRPTLAGRRKSRPAPVRRVPVGPDFPVEPLESRTLLAAAPPTLLREPTAVSLFAEAGDWTFFAESRSALYVTNGTRGGTFFVKGFGEISAITPVG